MNGHWHAPGLLWSFNRPTNYRHRNLNVMGSSWSHASRDKLGYKADQYVQNLGGKAINYLDFHSNWIHTLWTSRQMHK
jgi:hypothetical protein